MPNNSELQSTISRIRRMEQNLDAVLTAMKNCPSSINTEAAIQEKIRELTDYYENGQWLQDYDRDAAGELPVDLKRGVLSQDTLYDLLCEIRENCSNSIDDKLIESTYLFCRKRISDSEEAKDLSQDILCEALKAIRSGKSFVSFYSWYWKMARNKYADYVSGKKYMNEPLEYVMGAAADIMQPLDKLINEEDISVLNYALSHLTNVRREIIVRYYLKEQSIAEIADAMKIPVGTVKSRLFDTKKNLRERIKRVNYTGKSAYAPAEVDWFCGYRCKSAHYVMNQMIAQQVAVICRKDAKDIEEIADETGVPAVYLEQILGQMEGIGLVSKPSQNKYLTNFCVFPRQVYLEAEALACSVFYENQFPEKVSEIMQGLSEQVKALDFYGCDFEWEYLMWLGYVLAGYAIADIGTEYYIRKYKNKYPDEAERSYRITAQYTLPEETIDDSLYSGMKAMEWSNLHQEFGTAEYGNLEYGNNFQMSPFPAEGEGTEKGRDNWLDGNNIGLLVALTENPKRRLNDCEEEKVAEFIKNGLVVKSEEGLKVMLPVISGDVRAQIQKIVCDALWELAEEYAGLVGEKIEEILLPYVRKDLMSNFIHWDMKMFLQPIPFLFFYGLYESDCLAKPEDYSRSAAGLVIIKRER